MESLDKHKLGWAALNIGCIALYILVGIFGDSNRWLLLHTIGLIWAIAWSAESWEKYKITQKKSWLISFVICIVWFISEAIFWFIAL